LIPWRNVATSTGPEKQTVILGFTLIAFKTARKWVFYENEVNN